MVPAAIACCPLRTDAVGDASETPKFAPKTVSVVPPPAAPRIGCTRSTSGLKYLCSPAVEARRIGSDRIRSDRIGGYEKTGPVSAGTLFCPATLTST